MDGVVLIIFLSAAVLGALMWGITIFFNLPHIKPYAGTLALLLVATTCFVSLMGINGTLAFLALIAFLSWAGYQLFHSPLWEAQELAAQIGDFKPLTEDRFFDRVYAKNNERNVKVRASIAPQIGELFGDFIKSVYRMEFNRFKFSTPALPLFPTLEPHPLWPQILQQLRAQLELVKEYQQFLDAVVNATSLTLGEFVAPLHSVSGGGPFTIPLLDLVPDQRDFFYGLTLPWSIHNSVISSRLEGRVSELSQQQLPKYRFEAGERVEITKSEDPRAFMLFPFDLLLSMQVPYELEDRFRHQWVIGAHGSGKSTFLEALIYNDLPKVAAEQASVIVMDSQNELIPQLARSSVFAQGLLKDKLIYLETSEAHPLALNIFDTDNQSEMSVRGVLQMTNFFLKSVFKAETTAHQEVMLKYCIPALIHIPDATIFTLKDLMEDGGYERYEQYFVALDPDVQQWLRTRLHSPELKLTRTAVKARLDAFTADDLIRKMFRHPRNKVNLFKELQSSKVILINTNKGLLKESTEPLGRYFIAKLLQVSEDRMLLQSQNRLPVFCYIDEATDYIADEENIGELIDRARKQNIALIFAHQRIGHIRSPNVLDALRHCAIQCQLSEPPNVSITQKGKTVVAKVDKANSRRMSEDQWRAIQQDMWNRYSAPAEPPAAPKVPLSHEDVERLSKAVRLPRQSPPPQQERKKEVY